jgi:hypothetical protein
MVLISNDKELGRWVARWPREKAQMGRQSEWKRKFRAYFEKARAVSIDEMPGEGRINHEVIRDDS